MDCLNCNNPMDCIGTAYTKQEGKISKYLICKKCNSSAIIYYDTNGVTKEEVIWKKSSTLIPSKPEHPDPKLYNFDL